MRATIPPPPPPEEQTGPTDPGSAIPCKSTRHEYRQAYDARAAVDADGSMPVLATDVLPTTDDRAGLDALLDRIEAGPGLPHTLLADAGYAGEAVVEKLRNRGIEPLIAVTRRQAERPCDFKPPPDEKPRAVTAPWRLRMIEKLETDPARAHYRKRRRSVEPVLGFNTFSLCGIDDVKLEWTLLTLAWNCKRIAKLGA